MAKGNIRYMSIFSSDAAVSRDLDLAQFNPLAGRRVISNDAAVVKCEESMRGLDHERAFCIKGGYCLSACDGDKGSVGLTYRAISNIKDSVLTHNHPRDHRHESGMHGGTFSTSDVATLVMGMQQIRARSEEEGDRGTYIMERTPKADPRGLIGQIYRDRRLLEKRQKQVVARAKLKFEKGGYRSMSEATADAFNRQMKVYHRYYQAAAPRYGFVYRFEKDK